MTNTETKNITPEEFVSLVNKYTYINVHIIKKASCFGDIDCPHNWADTTDSLICENVDYGWFTNGRVGFNVTMSNRSLCIPVEGTSFKLVESDLQSALFVIKSPNTEPSKQFLLEVNCQGEKAPFSPKRTPRQITHKTFADEYYVDRSLSHKDEIGYVCVLNVHKFTDDADRGLVYRYMNRYLRGQNRFTQEARTLCYITDNESLDGIQSIGIYGLESKKVLCSMYVGG